MSPLIILGGLVVIRGIRGGKSMGKYCFVEFDNCLCLHDHVLSYDEIKELYYPMSLIPGTDENKIKKFEAFDFPLDKHYPNETLVKKLIDYNENQGYQLCVYSVGDMVSGGFKSWWIGQNTNLKINSLYGAAEIKDIKTFALMVLQPLQKEPLKEEDILIITREDI